MCRSGRLFGWQNLVVCPQHQGGGHHRADGGRPPEGRVLYPRGSISRPQMRLYWPSDCEGTSPWGGRHREGDVTVRTSPWGDTPEQTVLVSWMILCLCSHFNDTYNLCEYCCKCHQAWSSQTKDHDLLWCSVSTWTVHHVVFTTHLFFFCSLNNVSNH